MMNFRPTIVRPFNPCSSFSFVLSEPHHATLNDWIFGGTALGDALQKIAEHRTNEGNPHSLMVRGLLIPEGHFRGGSAFPTASD